MRKFNAPWAPSIFKPTKTAATAPFTHYFSLRQASHAQTSYDFLLQRLSTIIAEQPKRHNPFNLPHHVASALYSLGETTQLSAEDTQMQIKVMAICKQITQPLQRKNLSSMDISMTLFGLGKLHMGLFAQDPAFLKIAQAQAYPVYNYLLKHFEINQLEHYKLRQIAQGLVMLNIPVPQTIQKALNETASPCISKSQQTAIDALQNTGLTVEIEKLVCGAYHVDIYLPELNLIIEINGPQHDTPIQKRRDMIRDEVIKNTGHQLESISVIGKSPFTVAKEAVALAELYQSRQAPGMK